MTADTPEPHYRAFRVHYPHAMLDSVWCLEGGGTVRQVQAEHLLAVVEPVLESLVPTPGED